MKNKKGLVSTCSLIRHGLLSILGGLGYDIDYIDGAWSIEQMTKVILDYYSGGE